MLRLQTKPLNICQISKLFAKYNTKASISNEVIIFDGKISDELLSELCNNIAICNVQNFYDKVILPIQNENDYDKKNEIVSTSTNDENVTLKIVSDTIADQTVIEKYDLLYPNVKRGEVYICDFGNPYGSEQGYERYAIVVQNDDENLTSPTTIVLCCTTECKNILPIHHKFTFCDENMIDYNAFKVGTEQNVVLAEQIRTIDKTRLRKFIGTMKNEFMDKIQEIIDISLGLKRQKKVITIVKQVPVNVPVNNNAPKERKNLNMTQIQLLSLVDINELLKIYQSRDSDQIKVEKIINLFGFDMKRNGVQYLFKAILISPKYDYFNLETLCDEISKTEPNVTKDEIKRLIVARIKELFRFKKSPTIDFIRLVNSFLLKKEEEHD